jgi:hypothetical protein
VTTSYSMTSRSMALSCWLMGGSACGCVTTNVIVAGLSQARQMGLLGSACLNRPVLNQPA